MWLMSTPTPATERLSISTWCRWAAGYVGSDTFSYTLTDGREIGYDEAEIAALHAEGVV